MNNIEKNDFSITTDQDEIRVDGLCRELLREFHRTMLERGISPLEAGSLAHGADFFLRDFLVSARRASLFDERPGMVRCFAATWYIISTLEPTIEELAGYLGGVRELYRFLHSEGLISSRCLNDTEQECDDISYYGNRIESFFNITGDGYLDWERVCTLKTEETGGTP